MSEFIIFSFFHSPFSFSFVTKDGTGCVGRVGWPQKIFNPPYPDLKAGHPCHNFYSYIIIFYYFLFLHFLNHCSCTLLHFLSHCGCTFFNFLSHCGCTLFNFLSHCGCTLFNFLSHCGCTLFNFLSHCGCTFSKSLRLVYFLW